MDIGLIIPSQEQAFEGSGDAEKAVRARAMVERVRGRPYREQGNPLSG